MAPMLWLTNTIGSACFGDVAHFAQAFFLKLRIAHGQDFVDQEDLRFQVGGDGESQADVHAG